MPYYTKWPTLQISFLRQPHKTKIWMKGNFNQEVQQPFSRIWKPFSGTSRPLRLTVGGTGTDEDALVQLRLHVLLQVNNSQRVTSICRWNTELMHWLLGTCKSCVALCIKKKNKTLACPIQNHISNLHFLLWEQRSALVNPITCQKHQEKVSTLNSLVWGKYCF